MRIALGADHAGFFLKESLKPWLESGGYQVADLGAYALDPEDDYPDFAAAVARAVQVGDAGRLATIVTAAGRAWSISWGCWRPGIRRKPSAAVTAGWNRRIFKRACFMPARLSDGSGLSGRQGSPAIDGRSH